MTSVKLYSSLNWKFHQRQRTWCLPLENRGNATRQNPNQKRHHTLCAGYMCVCQHIKCNLFKNKINSKEAQSHNVGKQTCFLSYVESSQFYAYIWKHIDMWGQYHMKKREQERLIREWGRNWIQMMNMSYERGYEANCFVSSNSIMFFFFFFRKLDGA